LPDQIDKLAKDVTIDLGKIRAARTGGKTLTKEQTAAKESILAVLAPIQTAAKRKYSEDDEEHRENYYIGDTLASQGPDDIVIAAEAVLDLLTPGDNGEPPEDTLLGIKPDKQIKALADAIAAVGGTGAAQGNQKSDASALLEKVELAIAQLAKLRRQVQLAADQAWPWRTQGVKSIRKAFLLPPDRPLTE
jgi:hypothetical protein